MGGGLNSSLQCAAFPPVSVYQGLLQFNSRSHFQAFLVGLDSLQSKWTYYPGDETLQTAGDEALNAVDSFYGIISLRKKLAQDEYYGTEVVDSIATSIIDPDLENTLNSKLEFIIGDTIVKCVSQGQYALIPNKDMVALAAVRERGLSCDYPGVVYYNESQNYFYSYDNNLMTNMSGSSGSFSSSLNGTLTTMLSNSCGGTVRLYASATLGNFWNDCRLMSNLASPSGDCAYEREYSIDWGDGIVESYQPCRLGLPCDNSFSQQCMKYHAYNPSLIPAGGSRTFTIKVYAKYKSSSCDIALIGQVFQKEVLYTVYSEDECKKKKYEKDIVDPSLEFNFNGSKFRVRGKMGQNPSPFFSSIPGVHSKVWAEVIFEKFSENRWRKTTPYFSNFVRLKGYYKQNCSSFSIIPLGTEYSGKSKSKIKKYIIASNSGTSTLSDYQFKCDIQTKHLVGNFGLQDVKLW